MSCVSCTAVFSVEQSTMCPSNLIMRWSHTRKNPPASRMKALFALFFSSISFPYFRIILRRDGVLVYPVDQSMTWPGSTTSIAATEKKRAQSAARLSSSIVFALISISQSPSRVAVVNFFFLVLFGGWHRHSTETLSTTDLHRLSAPVHWPNYNH